MSILKSFTPYELEMTGSEIYRKVGIPKATAHRIITTLTGGGLLNRNEKTGKYMIGHVLYQLGSLYLDTIDIFKAAKPVMETMNDLTNEDVVLGILNKGNIVLVMKEESHHNFRIGRHVGSTFPAYASSMGKALLSELTKTELDSLYPEEILEPVTEKTITSKTKLELVLEEVKKTGVAFDKESGLIGVEGIASVIRDTSGKAVATICISMPVFRSNQAKRKRLANLIKMGSHLVSSRLGYQGMGNPVRDVEEIRSWWEQNQVTSDSQAKSDSHTVPISHIGNIAE